ncbi:THO2 plays a role in transcriptional elongation [Cladophialophora chaetospira]|uniref:THO complex subunit 2 n=1 Tax=Cladophialophora chaetospira TaxID=386627 RepID=A0AA38WY75_9EURO|nr:THO2 plays a role in transcriptional elongation [Cladophialophora chaetospira]
MPPPVGGKRKRPERGYSDDQPPNRPSPHRPQNLNLAQQSGYQSNDRDYSQQRGRGGRRPSRGGRGSYNVPSPVNSPADRMPTVSRTTVADPEPSNLNGNMTAPVLEAPVLSEPPAESQPYNYTHLTPETCESWETGGREDVLRQGLEGMQEDEGTQLTALMQELVQSVVYGRLSPSEAGDLVKQLLASEIQDDEPQSVPHPTVLQAALLDSISVVFDNNPTLPLDRLSVFILATDIPHELLRHELDAALLEKFNMIRNTFSRMGIRKQTNLLYRQANFNLMREESEGFAKLMTELFTTSSNEAPTADTVEETVEKVKAMIGAFDLDVGRSLDVVLDVCSAVLVKQCRFFVKFLRSSPWWPRLSAARGSQTLSGLPLWALPGSPDWHLTEGQKLSVAEETRIRDEAFWIDARERGLQAFYLLGGSRSTKEQLERASSSGDDLLVQWVKETGTVPPPGNRDAAQLLGFKLRFYSSSPARDETDILPDNLIYLSALLTKIGFVSLKDLYPHIWRTDDAMDELKEQRVKEKQERERAARPGAGAKNALLSAGALADDTLPVPARLKESNTRANTPSKEQDVEKPTQKENDPADQKVLLLKSLLAIGALPEALFILGRFPWLVDLIPELPEYIYRILHYSVSKVYGEVQPMQDRPTLRSQKPSYETDVPGVSKGQVKIVETAERKVLRWAQLDKTDSLDGTDYRFYWDEWNDNVPICRNVDDVFTLCNTFLPLVGVKIGQDVGLLLKFARIGKHSLHTDKSELNRLRWLDLIKRILLPSLSLTKSNAGVVNEVFELVSLFPVSVRYLMYLEWSSGRTSRNPDMKAAFDQARAETKDILKRISNTNVRPMARALAKIAFANPHIVITTALTQIEVYDSIAEVFVEGARYFTDLGYDVLTWSIVSSMAKTGRDRTQEGGIYASRWLSALSAFAGKIYKRYGMMKPGPILQYVVEQLGQGNTMDLKMLEQIVLSMAGISTDTSYNDTQLQAMGGGPVLQGQIILQLLDRRHDSKRTSERLMKSLQDTGLAAKFLITMAQQRQAVVFEDGDVPLKAIGNTYDEVHRVMVQYLDLLRTNLSMAEFRATVPDVVNLLVDYEIPPEIAFWIARPLLSQQMHEFDRENRKDQVGEEIRDINGDVEMSDQINNGSEEDGEAVETENMTVDSPAAGDAMSPPLDLDNGGKTPGLSESTPEDCWHPVMKDLMTAIRPSLPEEVVDVIGTPFYATFWQLSLYDIVVPNKSYDEETARQKKKEASVKTDRTDVSVSGTKKKDLAKKEVSDLIERLQAEHKQHMTAFLDGRVRLQREKEQWFLGKTRMDRALNTALMEHCFLPRMLSSPLDAYFCFKFLKLLHSGGTPNFRTLGFYDLFFRTSRLISLIFMCTSKEADNLGKFLNEVLKDLARWHGTKSIYEKEGCGPKKNLPGFAMKVEAGKVVALLDFENFQKIVFKWHSNLYVALQKCLSSPEYMHVRNAISVLRTISEIYPAVNWHGTGLQKAVDKLRESDKEDLKVSSQALLGALHKREKSWVETSKFRKGPEKKEPQQETPPAKSAVSQPAVASDPKPSEKPSNDPAKVDPPTDATPKPDVKPVPEQKGGAEPSKSSRLQPTAEPFRPSTRVTPRPSTPNGASTPSRQSTDASTVPKRDTRPRPEPAKPHDLPRRLTPPPSSRSNPAGLPNRPEPIDSRNGHRDSPRLSSRADIEPSRPPPELRAGHGRDARDARAGYRGSERPERPDHSFDDYDRHARRYDRLEGPPYPGREERGYGREHERRGPYDRPPPQERDRPPARPPVMERERETREPVPRSRPPPTAEPSRADSQALPRKETPSEPTINPARASLIDGGGDQRAASARTQGQERPSRPSRPSSPRREDDRKTNPRWEGDDRTRLEAASARQATHGPPPIDSTPASTRLSGPGPFRRDHREARQPPPIDMQHGRLEQESSPRAPPSQTNERAPQEAEVPSGPRSRPAAGGGPRLRAPPLNTQVPSSPSADRPTPTGPARRQHGRTSSYTEASSTPNTPAPDSAGVHPSRLGQIDAVASEATRANQVTQPSPQTHPPAGPRGNAPPGAPSGPSPTSRGPPSGPHSADASLRGGRTNRNPLTGINNTLAQAGTSSRGRGNTRQNSASFGQNMPPPPPPPPGGPPLSSLGPSVNGYPPNDLFASSNPNDVPVGNRAPSSRHDNSRGDRRTELVDDRGSERRTSRHSSRHDESRGDRDHRNDRDGRDASKEERYGGSDPSRRDERPGRRDNHPQEGEDRRGGHSRPSPRDETQPSRKHGRDEEPGAYGRGGGSGGRGGSSRVTSESKRIRRGA